MTVGDEIEEKLRAAYFKAARLYEYPGCSAEERDASEAEIEAALRQLSDVELASAHFATEIATLRRALDERTAELVGVRDSARRALTTAEREIARLRAIDEDLRAERDRFRRLYERTLGQLVILRSAAKAALLAAPRVRAVTTDQLSAEEALRVAIVDSDP